MKGENLKLIVKEKYGEIAGQSKDQNESSCCGASGCSSPEVDYTIFSDDYSKLAGYNPDADMGLGCGLPLEFDLGSGAGNDCFVARSQVGPTGKVTGLDFTEEMLTRAHQNLNKSGFSNIEFIKGDIENIPLQDNLYDVVISNCVLNLVPDKLKAFEEIYRVLRPGGHFCISDVVLDGKLPDKLLNAAEMYAGCVSGAMQKSEYLEIINRLGFRYTEIRKEKEIKIPNSILSQYLDLDELRELKKQRSKIISITVTAGR